MCHLYLTVRACDVTTVQKVIIQCPTTHHTSVDKWVHMQVNVHKFGPEGGVDLNRAMSTIYNETRAFLMHNYDITEDVVGALLNESQLVPGCTGFHANCDVCSWV